ncbi:MAG TPA: AMP-binding protein [Caulobacteraceae bacterium]|nr:AMP-binding protein [Caulobacteraceae bacterium]
MILDRIAEHAVARPDAVALIHNERRVGYAAFAAAIEATRRFLAAQGLPGEGVAVVLAPDALEAWLLVLGARALGLTTLVAFSMADAEALAIRGLVAVLRGPTDPQAPAAGALAAAPSLSIPAAAFQGEPGLLPPRGGAIGGHILYSSGTTGAFKKVLADGASDEGRNEARVRVSGFGPDTVYHVLSYGLWTGIGFKSPQAVWHAGGTVVSDQTPSAAARFLSHDPTYAQTTPEILKAIVEAHPPGHPPSERLLLRVGGGFTSPELAQAAVQRIATRLVVGFSSTEMAAALLLSEFRDADDLVWLKPNPARRIEVADEAGEPCADGVEGELRIRVTEVDSQGYLDDDETTARFFRDGWFYPGDLAVRRGDGRIRILGRAGDVLNIRGRKIAVGPVEQTLQQALGVEEVCLFAGQGDDGATEVVVCVQTQADLTPVEIAARLGPSEIFERVRVEIFRAFPRTTTGLAKTRRVELRRMVLGGR